ncbi:MAG: BtaA family protein [Pyrinomonadaceae bacterium]|nr:BtaA family protein [Pyrinomonadaceae bacterium]
MADSLVLKAVKNESTASKAGMLQRLFAAWFDAFVYNQIWEDPSVDLEALELDGTSNVLTISSGGCNALNYLLASPASVTAVDLNRHHIALLDLKIAALKTLPSYEEFFEFFGKGGGPDSCVNYLRYIRPSLGKDARRFWESNTFGGSLLFGDRIAFFNDGRFYDHSRNGYFLKFFHRLSHLLGCRPEKVLEARDLAEQAELFEEHVDPFFDSLIIRFVGKLPVTMFGLGIPPQQYEELKKEAGNGRSIIAIYRERVRRLACDFPISENCFAWQAFARRYDTANRVAVPDYLKEPNFGLLQANAGRVTTAVASVTDVINDNPAGTFDRFVLLDAQDWMNPSQISQLWTAIAGKAPSGSRIIFRTAGSSSPVETALPAELRERFRYEEALSRELFKRDRASIYGGFHLYIRK